MCDILDKYSAYFYYAEYLSKSEKYPQEFKVSLCKKQK